MHPSASPSCNLELLPLCDHFFDHPMCFASVIIYATSRVTNPVFIYLAQVLNSPNELRAWFLHGVHNRSGTDVCHESNQPSMPLR
jgi:hypothetical protein